MSFLILGNILDFPSVIYFQVHFYSNEDIFVCCLLMSNTSFESIIKLICKKKKSHSGQLWLFVKLNEHQIQKLVYIMHILFHNNTIFNNWFFFMFSVAFLDRYHGTVPQASVIFNKNTQHVDTQAFRRVWLPK